jgi:8-oxo-dGTP pyrophosphatase MutT (NUDIX family)
METTRHFVATVYVVNDGAVALHHHDKLDMWLPAGGHIELDELPHEAATRETREELGLDVELFAPVDDLSSTTAESIPKPQHFLLEDINVVDGEVGHQHVDFVYYGRAQSRNIDPAAGEADAEVWEWIAKDELQSWADDLHADVLEASERAIEAVEQNQ